MCCVLCVKLRKGEQKDHAPGNHYPRGLDVRPDEPEVCAIIKAPRSIQEPNGMQPDNVIPDSASPGSASSQITIDVEREDVRYENNQHFRDENCQQPSSSDTNSKHVDDKSESPPNMGHDILEDTETSVADNSMAPLLDKSKRTESSQEQSHKDRDGGGNNNGVVSTSVQAGHTDREDEIDLDDLEEVEPDEAGYYNQPVQFAWPTREQITDFNEYYDMTGKVKGYAFILNNKSFPNHQNLKFRKGSEVDLANMTHLWKEIGYEVIKHEDLTGKEISAKICEFSAKCNDPKCSSAVIVLMSHGSQGQIQGTDLGLVPLNEIQQQFDSIHCPNLRGKPKLFFYQACRLGDVEITHHGGWSMPDENADMFFAQATTEGSRSIRSPKNGSWFVNVISEIFIQRVHLDEIEKLMKRVNNRITKKRGKSEGELVQQTSEHTSRLTKDLYFFPKFYYDESRKAYLSEKE
ncbi:caspase-7-like [Amphiura filiformis]|uniref:caspase-7-like n=1 Tax=Amphiura filiformis TaxID=82378 RepID=UPI003B20E017